MFFMLPVPHIPFFSTSPLSKMAEAKKDLEEPEKRATEAFQVGRRIF